MDPTANLKEQRRVAAEIVARFGVDDVGYLASELAELVQALDQWLSGGGFLPEPWKR